MKDKDKKTVANVNYNLDYLPAIRKHNAAEMKKWRESVLMQALEVNKAKVIRTYKEKKNLSFNLDTEEEPDSTYYLYQWSNGSSLGEWLSGGPGDTIRSR